VRLDDFYRDEDDPAMPRSRELGIIDWDDPASWDAEAAVAALERLVSTGAVSTPVYDISLSRAIGRRELRCRADDLVLAEGIFAAEVIGELRGRDLLAAAYCVHRPRLLTFCWRLLRDLSEHRKPALTLLRRGVALMRAEPDVVARQAELGARPVRPTTVEAELRGGTA
jgi:uridine kinase